MKLLARTWVIAVAAAVIAVPGVAGAHELFDHAPPALTPAPAPVKVAQFGGPGAKWEFVDSIVTGNPHTDLDFFTRGGETFLSAGTLGVAPNGGGQTIVQLTDGDQVDPQVRLAGADRVVRRQRGRGARPAARRRGVAEGRDDPQREQPAGRARRRADRRRRDRRAGPLPRQPVLRRRVAGRRERQARRARDHRRHRPGEPGRDRPHLAHRRGAHGQHRPEAAAHRLRRHVRQRVVAADGKRSNETSGYALDGFEVVDMSSCMNFPARHDGRREARRLPAAGVPLPLPERRDGDGPHEQGQHLRLPRARGLRRRPPDLRQRRRADRARHERRVRRPRHAEEPRRRPPGAARRSPAPSATAPRRSSRPARR